MGNLSRFYHPVVLVVDDDADIRDTLAHMLTVRGFRVLTAGDGASALAICRGPERVEALVADLSLPGEVGGDAARVVAQQFPDIKIVYATGIPRNVSLASGLVRPDAPYLEKPVDADVLASLLRGLLVQHVPDADPWR